MHKMGLSKSGDTRAPRNFGAPNTTLERVDGLDVRKLLTASEAALLDAFRATAEEARGDILGMVRAIAEGSPQQRLQPALVLVAIGGESYIKRRGDTHATN